MQVGVRLTSDDDHRDCRIELDDSFQCVDPAEPRHREIQDDRVGARAFDLEKRLEPVLRLKHVKALQADVLTEYGTHLGVVVDDEHSLRGGVLGNGLLL